VVDSARLLSVRHKRVLSDVPLQLTNSARILCNKEKTFASENGMEDIADSSKHDEKRKAEEK
jgi:hypothetical protein